MPLILAGLRTSVIVNIGTATIGATIGAGGLGSPIISGLVTQNPSYLAEGADSGGPSRPGRGCPLRGGFAEAGWLAAAPAARPPLRVLDRQEGDQGGAHRESGAGDQDDTESRGEGEGDRGPDSGLGRLARPGGGRVAPRSREPAWVLE